jgi:filamentous hemagglutinin
VAPEKVRDYLLLPDHPDNDGKAIFFALFGFTRERWSELHSAQIAHPAANNVVRMAQTGDGTRYRVRCNLVSPDGRNPCITTIWAVEPGQPPRLITSFPGQAP